MSFPMKNISHWTIITSTVVEAETVLLCKWDDFSIKARKLEVTSDLDVTLGMAGGGRVWRNWGWQPPAPAPSRWAAGWALHSGKRVLGGSGDHRGIRSVQVSHAWNFSTTYWFCNNMKYKHKKGLRNKIFKKGSRFDLKNKFCYLITFLTGITYI